MPLQVYFKNGRVKIEIGLARGKKLYDKRQDIRKKDMKREMEREKVQLKKLRIKGPDQRGRADLTFPDITVIIDI